MEHALKVVGVKAEAEPPHPLLAPHHQREHHHRAANDNHHHQHHIKHPGVIARLGRSEPILTGHEYRAVPGSSGHHNHHHMHQGHRHKGGAPGSGQSAELLYDARHTAAEFLYASEVNQHLAEQGRSESVRLQDDNLAYFY